MGKIHCPKHPFPEKTASCDINYDTNRYKCWGCGAAGWLDELGLGNGSRKRVAGDVYKEDMVDSLKYIESLPVKVIRGVSIKASDDNMYIVWPNGDYYKSRSLTTDKGSKYKCPAGHKKPLFYLKRSKGMSWWARALILVEGELNALSIREVAPWIDIISPGGTADILASVKKDLNIYRMYSSILVMVDADPPGTAAGLTASAALRDAGIKTYLHTMNKDANERLVQDGAKALEEDIRQCLAKLS